MIIDTDLIDGANAHSHNYITGVCIHMFCISSALLTWQSCGEWMNPTYWIICNSLMTILVLINIIFRVSHDIRVYTPSGVIFAITCDCVMICAGIISLLRHGYCCSHTVFVIAFAMIMMKSINIISISIYVSIT